MKIGIMGAMPEEIDGIKKSFNFQLKNKLGEREYYYKQLKNDQRTDELFLVFSRWGKVAASSTATTLINQFNVDIIIFTGVAGAIDPKLNVGDIVVSDNLIQHDMNTEPLFNRFEIPLTGKAYFATHDKLTDFLIETITETMSTAAFKNLPLKNFNITEPTLYLGTIATGDQFVNDAVLANNLLNSINNLHCVDMESGAVAQVCHDYSIPFVAIRTISDKADHSAPVDFLRFTKEVASQMHQLVIENILHNLSSKIANISTLEGQT